MLHHVIRVHRELRPIFERRRYWNKPLTRKEWALIQRLAVDEAQALSVSARLEVLARIAEQIIDQPAQMGGSST